MYPKMSEGVEQNPSFNGKHTNLVCYNLVTSTSSAGVNYSVSISHKNGLAIYVKLH